MNSEQLICFAAVVQEGTISGGARRLNLSQPPVSLQIKNLEKNAIWNRGRQIRLTEAGKVLYDYAQRYWSCSRQPKRYAEFSGGKQG